MTEEWLTYREIGARLGLNVEAARTRVRRAGWRTQPGNDGRTRVLVPDQAFVESVNEDDGRVTEGVNRTADLTGLVTLLTASEARISRMERQIEAEHDRVNTARSEADRLRAEAVSLTAQVARAEQASTEARDRAVQAEARQAAAEARALNAEAEAAELQCQVEAAQIAQAEAEAGAAELRQADDARKARGRLRRAWDGWRGR